MKTSASELKPPLKWAGGKRWLVPFLQPIWAAHNGRRLVEPFSGGLAVSFGLRPDRAILNDINPHSINFFRWLKRGLTTESPMVNDQALYYRNRQCFNDMIKGGQMWSKKAGELFYYLNRTCFNGLCRFNRKGEFNVPFGRYGKIQYVTDFLGYRDVFRSWDFTCRDFEELELRPDDFIYADPPYDVEFTTYSKEGFNWQDQVRVARWLSRHPGPVILSNQATPRILNLYSEFGFKLQLLDAPRRISCNGDRRPAKEVLATRGL